jgi:hypothetical protein
MAHSTSLDEHAILLVRREFFIRASEAHTEPHTSHADEPVQYAQLMENIWDWNEFIIPHLYSSNSTQFTCISEPHHFRFFQRNNQPHV